MNKKKTDKKKIKASTVDQFKAEILRFLKQKPGKAYSQKDVSRSLGVNKASYHTFNEAFINLKKERQIMRVEGKKFTFPSEPQIIQGRMMLTRRGFGFVEIAETGEEIFIPAPHVNRAFDGDIVNVQLFANSRGRKKEGQVISIAERSRGIFVGVFHKSAHYGFVVPDSQKVSRDFYIRSSNDLKSKDGQKVVIEFLTWEESAMNPEGKVVEILGFPDEAGVDVVSIVKGFDLPLEFSKNVEREAEGISWNISEEVLADRLDLRDELIFTIDPEDAKDFDDAISLKKLENGNYQLGVHIADVSHFVEEDSLLDKEALNRGTSIYLVDRVVPMLPEKLSNEICSLKPNEPRLTFSCVMEIDGSSKVVKYNIQPSIIESKRRFNYEEVQDIIDDAKSDDPMAAHLREVRDFGMKLREARLKKGSIDFDTPEVRFILDEKGKPVDVVPVMRQESNELIEEFMLMANQTVSEYITELKSKELQRPFVYRVHEKPDAEKIERFNQFLGALGYKTRLPQEVTPMQFQQALASVLGSKDDILIREVALRTMMKASYSTKNIGHFGLAFKDYTHFTSPIRRYPDLIVHRLLKIYATPVTEKITDEIKKNLKPICQRCSERERVALEAERESIKLKQVEWISRHVNEEYPGIITGVTARGMFVEITPQLIEGFINVEELTDDYYIFNEKTYSLVGKEFEKMFRLGDEVRIKVKKVDIETKMIDFVLAEEEE